VLGQLIPAVDPRLLVGPETLDDAAALKVSDDLAICFTADFITPVVDDPNAWGQIAAANSLSDVYAMGARPLAALNLVCWPECLPPEVLIAILQGAAAAAKESGCLIVGGHTVQDREPKYGMAVIGTVHPDRILRNRGALPGDALYLTKPLGTGILATAVKAELAGPEEIEAAVQSMTSLNRQASEAALAASARAMTDVTGFGLLGHLTEMLGSTDNLGVEVSAKTLPLLPGVLRLMQMGLIPAGAYRNRDAYHQRVRLPEKVRDELELLLYDPQTSGGLLAAVPPEAGMRFEQEALKREVAVSRIGAFNDAGRIDVVP